MALKGPCTWPPKGGVASRLTCRRLKRLMSGILFLGILDLIYDVLFDGFFVNIAHRLCIVSTRPKAAIPFAPHVRVLVKYHQRGLPFQVSNKVRYAQLRRNVYAQMYMICTYRPRYDFYFFVLDNVRMISRTSSRTFPYITFFRYFGINTIWYWHSQHECAKLDLSTLDDLLCSSLACDTSLIVAQEVFIFARPSRLSPISPA